MILLLIWFVDKYKENTFDTFSVHWYMLFSLLSKRDKVSYCSDDDHCEEETRKDDTNDHFASC